MDYIFDFSQGFLAFSILIIITVGWHEFGHFIVAKLSGVKVLEFAIGMGKTIYEKKGSDGVVYKLCAFPVGGYVRMLNDSDLEGEDKDKHSPEDKFRTFESASVIKRSLIVGAGPFANFILALGIFSFLGYNYTYSFKAEVGYVSENIKYIESSAPLEIGDVIIEANGNKITNTSDFTINTLDSIGSVLHLKTKNGKNVLIDMHEEKLTNKTPNPQDLMGFNFSSNNLTNVISKTFPDTPAEKYGLKEGDEIKGINGIKTPNFYEINRALSKISEGETAQLEVLRGEELISMSILPEYVGNELDDKKAKIGFSVSLGELDQNLIINQEKTIPESIKHGFDMVYDLADMTLTTIYKIATGDVSPKLLGGAVTIGHTAKVQMEKGYIDFLSYLAFFNVNLMVMNLLPIPPLDGGHLAKFGVETVIRRKIKEQYLNYIQMIGMTAVGTLLIWGLFADYLRFFN